METTTPKIFVFVLMPFKHEFDEKGKKKLLSESLLN